MIGQYLWLPDKFTCGDELGTSTEFAQMTIEAWTNGPVIKNQVSASSSHRELS